MKKIFTLITALTLSVGLWATSIWSGSHDVTGTNSLKIDASKFASALPGNKLTIFLSVNDGTNDAIEFKANGQKLPGTRFSICQDWWETYDLFMTQDMIDSCKVYGMEICGDNFTVTKVDLSEGKAANMKEGKVIWTGYSWVDSWSMLEVFKEALTAVKDWDKYKTMRFYSECPTTDNLIFLLANQDGEAGVIAESEPSTDEQAAGNPLKRYEGYAELDLTKVNPLTVINNVSSDRLMIQMDKQGSAAFNFTDVVLVEQTAPVPATLDSLVIKGKAEKMEYELGEAFDPAGLEVWGIYTKYVKNDSTSLIKSGITWTLDPETFEEASDNASVTMVASYKEFTTADTTITSIKVKEKVPKYTSYENWQIKYGNEWVWTENMTKVEEGLFKLEIKWEGTGFNVKSDDNPIKKDWYDPKDPDVHIAEEVIPPVTVDVYLRVIDDETLKIGIGEAPPVPASGPTVDKTGITVNGRKYGFPVRLVKEVK